MLFILPNEIATVAIWSCLTGAKVFNAADNFVTGGVVGKVMDARSGAIEIRTSFEKSEQTC